MKKMMRLSVFMTALLLALMLPFSNAQAATLKDGTYSVNYTVLKAEGNAVSMANDYWLKPAKVIAKNGKLTVQMTIKNSSWVTEFKVPGNGGYVDTTVLSTNKKANTRLVQFQAQSLSKPIKSKIHVTVKSADYDHDYTIQLKFDESSMKSLSSNSTNKSAGAAEDQQPSKESTKTSDSSTTKQEENPQTGDTNQTGWLLVLALCSGGFLARKWIIKH
ncbi:MULTISPECIES: heme uptake protein IsdC [Bacillus]|jgi:heme uptake protein IsdC|uniref:Heme uptake protein IsdC n=1 Tax=Bacillus pumilus TaxID=1408 RepID=A0AAE4B962_BACPU|nr:MULTISPECIES: heme uptake protein IsdC [Bacillus]AOC58320.1 heme uptake protein IsdC [Bacillus pumilus]AZV55098.1 heme uptake protein IsdC [Bacillus pumilus]MBR0586896.1 heme uptake protein IsdC [Bacillus pumilus DW2J2]MBR0616128.1 heme uptake protein IsdC [Bacillus pumilus]MBR0620323.1 heme uptake protein IsdC [Bacillus pumilus]